VENGDKKRALDHFHDPKKAIESWYEREIRSYYQALSDGTAFSKEFETQFQLYYERISAAKNMEHGT